MACWHIRSRNSAHTTDLQKKKAKLTEVEEAVVHGVPDAAAEAEAANGIGEKKKKKKKRVCPRARLLVAVTERACVHGIAVPLAQWRCQA